MINEQIVETNKLIAEFMGYAFLDDFNYPENNEIGWYNEKGNCFGMDLKFHSSWDWLMSVVEKVESLGFWFNIKKNHVSVTWDNKDTNDSTMIYSQWGDWSKIQRTYICVVHFITWWNSKNE